MPAYRALLLALALVAASACSHTESSATTSADSTTAPDATTTTDPFGSVTPGPDAGSATAADASVTPAAASIASPPVATTAAAVAVASAPVVAATTPTPAPSSSLKHVALTDISGTAGEAAIKNLAALGAIEPATGAFHPHDPLTRATFVRWLVKANDAEQSGAADQIRPSETTADSYFLDVAPSNPDYKYIQGMADAGFVVGIDAKHFAPARNITREEMIAIYMNRAVGGKSYQAKSTDDTGDTFTDLSSISKPYWGAFHDDNYAFWRGNVARTFGAIRTLHPQRLATREEAAILVSIIQYGDAAKSVQAAGAPGH